MTSATLFPAHVAEPSPPEAAAPPAPLPGSRQVELEALTARTALNRQRDTTWFDWSANPYRGCEFGCGYCYARYSHEYLGHGRPRDFQEKIYVKAGFAEALRRDLRTRVRPAQHIAFGTATDPYQPIERRERVTRAALRELLDVQELRISITTKSQLVTRDLDLLTRIAKRNAVQVNFSITTPDRRLARFLEPRAPAPGLRFAALRRIREAGVHAGVFVMPLLPGVTDAEADLRKLIADARDAGAEFLGCQVVFLREPGRSHFLGELRGVYPRVAARYEVWTRSTSRLPRELRDAVLRRVRRMAEGHGLPSRLGLELPRPSLHVQQTFEWGGAGP